MLASQSYYKASKANSVQANVGHWSSKTTRNQEKARDKASKAIKNKKFMKMGLQKYIDYWKNRMFKCEGFSTIFGPYVDYWARVLAE
jgi:hypothetical protein